MQSLLKSCDTYRLTHFEKNRNKSQNTNVVVLEIVRSSIGYSLFPHLIVPPAQSHKASCFWEVFCWFKLRCLRCFCVTFFCKSMLNLHRKAQDDGNLTFVDEMNRGLREMTLEEELRAFRKDEPVRCGWKSPVNRNLKHTVLLCCVVCSTFLST